MSKHWSLAGPTSNVPIVADEQLLDECARGDRRAQYRLYSQCYSFMMSICIRYTPSRDEAEDLLNRSFLKILNSVGKRRKEVPFTLWVRRITINTVIDEYRKNKKANAQTELVDFNENPGEFEGAAINTYLEKVEAEQLQALINTLPEMSRKVFNLFAVDGYSHKEIAELLGMSDGTSKWHLNNARTRLKEQIAKRLPYLKNLAS
jgi:RNA polymerase sigma factor (sigma-70 family)